MSHKHIWGHLKQASSELTPTPSKEATVEAGEMVQPVKCLLDNHKDPSSIPSNCQKSHSWWHEPAVPEMGDRGRNTLEFGGSGFSERLS